MTFIAEEKVQNKKNIFRVFFRFLWDLPLARNLFLPAFLFCLLASFTPQIFLWKISQSTLAAPSARDRIFEIISSTINSSLAPDKFLFVLIAWALIFKVLSLVGIEIFGQWSTKDLHSRMIEALSRTRTTYFDENPSGKLINRIVGDYANIRLHGITFLADAQYSIAELICVTFVLSLANPWPMIFVIPVLWAYVYFQSRFSPMIGHSHSLKSILQGELLHRETDLIYGQSTYSFYKKQGYLLSSIEKIYRRILNLEIFHARLSAWGFFWMGMASLTFVSIGYISVFFGLQSHSLTIPLAAVVLSVLFTLEGSLVWVAMTMTNLSSAAAYIQRAYEIIDLPSEESEEGIGFPRDTTGGAIGGAIGGVKNKSTLVIGDIEYSNYSMAYRPDQPNIIQDLNMTIKMGEHVGIIGRTGSGKSSWLQSLLRMVLVKSGDIRIGNLSVFDMDIEDYRKLFGVIPQEPYLFAGTLRSNLIGFNGVQSDGQLKEVFSKLNVNIQLDTPVSEGGGNLSLGERQIICIIRGILQGKNYILLDEPTGSLDPKTEAQIQSLLTEQLRDKTVIMIAHRVESLRNFDKIFYFESGRLIRSGPPQEIIPTLRSPSG